MAIAGKNARIKVMSDEVLEPITFTEESTTPDATNKIFTIDNRDMCYWSRDVAVVVERDDTGWVTVDSSEYRIQYCGGKIHFHEAETNDIRVSGGYVTATTATKIREYTLSIRTHLEDTTWLEPTEDQGATEWTVDTSYSLGDYVYATASAHPTLYFECTTAGSSHATTEPTWNTTPGAITTDNTVEWTTRLKYGGYRRRTPTLVEATGTLTGFYDVDNLLQDRLLNGTPIVIEMDMDVTGDGDDQLFAVYAYLESKELAAAVEGVVGTSVAWQSHGDILVEPK